MGDQICPQKSYVVDYFKELYLMIISSDNTFEILFNMSTFLVNFSIIFSLNSLWRLFQ